MCMLTHCIKTAADHYADPYKKTDLSYESLFHSNKIHTAYLTTSNTQIKSEM